ncbi:ICOS ligand isoform X2 [Dicentrarchus labrax]|uniref:ICOS ligand isoform X2 n=1 Tax=Dicentrarchus labrax TaxID=13489 RepID=UPI0021F58FA0|nr:ICOS ligand isoform X2 [Dicentrarchus labrax]
MYSTILLILLLSASTIGQISGQFLSATVGGSVLIPCSLPVPPRRIKWFYWQEDQSNNILFHWHTNGQTQPIADEYKNRCQVFSTEFSSGNISIRLDNVAVGHDNKTFWANVRLMDEKESKKHCKSTLQVSAPYQHLVLTVNNTANRATCTAHGGYPEPKVSWTGLNKSSTAQLDLQDAETSLQQDPTEKTFSVTSSVSVKEFQSVTCIIFNPRTNQTIKETAEINDSGKDTQSKHDWTNGEIAGLVIGILILILIAIICVCLYRRRAPAEGADPPLPVPADGNEEDLQEDQPDQGLLAQDKRCIQNLQDPPNANEDPAEGNVLDLLNASGQNQPEENSPLMRRNGAESSTDEDAATGGGGASGGADAEHDKSSAPAEGADPSLPVPADGNEEDLQEDQPDQGFPAQDIRCVQNLQDPPNANEDPAEGNVLDVLLNVSGQNQPEENIPRRRRNGAESSTDEDAATGGGGASGGADAEHDKSS